MPKFKLKHSSVAGKAPLPADLIEGELALNINSTSPAAYIKDSTGAIVKLAGAGAVAADATETVKGVVELATAAETTAGTDATRAVHPAGLKVELDKKAPLASPALTGVPTAPTAAAGTNTTQVATTAFVAGAQNWTRTGTTLAPKTAGDVVSVSAGTAALPGLTPVGDPNTGLWAPAADTLALSTNGTERVRVDSDGKLLVGTSSAGALSARSTVATTGQHCSSSQKFGANADPGVISIVKSRAATPSDAPVPVEINDEIGTLGFYATDAVNLPRTAATIKVGVEKALPGTGGIPGYLFIGTCPSGSTSPAERLRITSDGYLRMAAGTGGIQFGGNTAAANALDDYEEGTWTPTIRGSTVVGTATYTVQVGRYTKVGNRVTFSLKIVYAAFTGTGNTYIFLPMAATSAANCDQVFSVLLTDYALTANNVPAAAVFPGGTIVQLLQMPVGGGAPYTGAPVDTAATIIMSGSYEVA